MITMTINDYQYLDIFFSIYQFINLSIFVYTGVGIDVPIVGDFEHHITTTAISVGDEIFSILG